MRRRSCIMDFDLMVVSVFSVASANTLGSDPATGTGAAADGVRAEPARQPSWWAVTWGSRKTGGRKSPKPGRQGKGQIDPSAHAGLRRARRTAAQHHTDFPWPRG